MLSNKTYEYCAWIQIRQIHSDEGKTFSKKE